MKTIVPWALALTTGVLLTLAGCGGGDAPIGRDSRKPKKAKGGEETAKTDEPKETKKKTSAEAATPFPKDKATAKIVGKTLVPGREPKEGKKIDISANPDCAKLHTEDKPLRYEFETIGAGGALANAIVYVAEGWEKYSFEPPADVPVIDQKGCHYEPHVLTMMAGQALKIRNSDPTLHNINSAGENPMNISQAAQGREDIKPIKNPEMPLKFKCDVHQWMGAYVGVFEHPFHAVSKPDGSFEIAEKLVPGEYTLKAWHETLGEVTQKVTVGEGETKSVEFSFKK